MQATSHAPQHGRGHIPSPWHAPQLPGSHTKDGVLPHPTTGLTIRVLKTEQEQTAIADLRRLAAFGVEDDLGLDLACFEKVRDNIGIVTAIHLDERPIATIRFVPTGRGLTAAERLHTHRCAGAAAFGDHSWEVGRIIMAPENRDPALLRRCLGLALTALLELERPQHLHASVTLPMARLWRHFGMKTAATVCGVSGARYALVEGEVGKIATILQVPSLSH